MKLKIAAFASHGGSNLQAIINGIKNKQLDAKIQVVISNNSKSYALERARKEEILTYHISSYKYKDVEEKILSVLEENEINLIILVGYMKKLPSMVIEKYYNHILNIHPALLPLYGGKGMYGINVHQAVIDAKDKYSGVTIHQVNNNYDDGKILNQVKVNVLESDTPETLAKRVLKEEHKIFLETLIKVSENEIIL